MSTISNNSLNVAFTQHQLRLSPAETQVAKQAMQTLMGDLQHCGPNLSNDVQALLGLQQRGLPSAGGVGENPFAALSAMDPALAMAGAARGPVADEFFSRAQLMANIDQMYGAGTASLLQRGEDSMQRSQLGLVAALSGGSKDDIAKILGDNPHSKALAGHLHGLAKEITRQPPDPQRLGAAAQKADWAILHHATPKDSAGRARLKQVFKQQYGVDRPGAQPYNGGGNFGNQVASVAPGAANVPEPTGTGAGPRALSLAASQVGVREATGNNDGLPAQRYSNGRKEPWCANFVAWTFRQSGNPLPGNQRSLASVQNMEDEMKKAGKFFPRGSGTPKPGDVIFFGNRGQSDRGPGRHVGIVDRVENGKVYTIEGNSGNAVARRSYDLNNARITGYGRN